MNTTLLLLMFQTIKIFAGAVTDDQGKTTPVGTGRLCHWTHQGDTDADDFESFGAYQRTLQLKCDQGEPGVIQWTPDKDTPDTVYYQVSSLVPNIYKTPYEFFNLFFPFSVSLTDIWVGKSTFSTNATYPLPAVIPNQFTSHHLTQWKISERQISKPVLR